MTSIRDAICNTIHDCVAPIDGYEEETADAIVAALLTAGYVIVPVTADGCCASCDGHACDDRRSI